MLAGWGADIHMLFEHMQKVKARLNTLEMEWGSVGERLDALESAQEARSGAQNTQTRESTSKGETRLGKASREREDLWRRYVDKVREVTRLRNTDEGDEYVN